MEMAFLPIFSNMPKPGEAEMLERFQAGQEIYAAAGITTAQEGATHAKDLELLQKAAAQQRLFIDVVALPFITEAKEIIKNNPPATFGTYRNRLKLGGIKITSDGSPQGKTAFFTTPYLTGGPSGETDWKGEPSFPKAELQEMVKFVYDQKLQLFIHCNGDAAIDMFLNAHELAASDRTADLRTTVIHSQFVRQDQLEKYVELQDHSVFLHGALFLLRRNAYQEPRSETGRVLEPDEDRPRDGHPMCEPHRFQRVPHRPVVRGLVGREPHFPRRDRDRCRRADHPAPSLEGDHLGRRVHVPGRRSAKARSKSANWRTS